jgi:hypothetical protein
VAICDIFQDAISQPVYFSTKNIKEIFENAQATVKTSNTSVISVDVEVKGPKCANYFQMRGSHTPSWFKGKKRHMTFYFQILCIASMFFLYT